jgi:hypothetical protein
MAFLKPQIFQWPQVVYELLRSLRFTPLQLLDRLEHPVAWAEIPRCALSLGRYTELTSEARWRRSAVREPTWQWDESVQREIITRAGFILERAQRDLRTLRNPSVLVTMHVADPLWLLAMRACISI